MKILFIFARPQPYNSVTVREKPCGGTEKAVIFLGEALARLGHEVEWITTTDELRAYSGSPDVVVTQIAELLQHFPAARKVWWAHHFSDQPVIKANAGFARAYADQIVTLSSCHNQDFSSVLRLDSVTIGHGVWLEELNTTQIKDPYRLIYASTPFRGLERIPELFRAIKAKEPRATIGIASSMATYGEAGGDDQYQELFRELAAIPGVDLLGALNQEALYREYARASVFFYPCVWPETYCLALDEAIAHGCRPVVSRIGALPERDWTGHALDRIPEFPEAALWVMANPERMAPSWTPRDWMAVAREWEERVLS